MLTEAFYTISKRPRNGRFTLSLKPEVKSDKEYLYVFLFCVTTFLSCDSQDLASTWLKRWYSMLLGGSVNMSAVESGLGGKDPSWMSGRVYQTGCWMKWKVTEAGQSLLSAHTTPPWPEVFSPAGPFRPQTSGSFAFEQGLMPEAFQRASIPELGLHSVSGAAKHQLAFLVLLAPL